MSCKEMEEISLRLCGSKFQNFCTATLMDMLRMEESLNPGIVSKLEQEDLYTWVGVWRKVQSNKATPPYHSECLVQCIRCSKNL